MHSPALGNANRGVITWATNLESQKGPVLYGLPYPVITYGEIMAGLISYRGYDYTDQGTAFAKDAKVA
jgi:hypothetical protein